MTRAITLVPLDEILERAEKHLMYQHLPQNKETASFRLVITSIRLSSSLVSVANETTIGRMIPTWDFCYDIVFEDVKSGYVGVDSYVLTLNAIDGSYIEPRIVKTIINEVMEDW